MPIETACQESRRKKRQEESVQDCLNHPSRKCGQVERKSSVVTAVDSRMLSCSQQSIFSAMDRFVKAVNNVSATVLVPSKLRDMDIPGRKVSRRIPPALANTDLYSFYVMIHDVKKELLWGPATGVVLAAATSMPATSSGRSTPRTSTVTAPASFLMEHQQQMILQKQQQLQQNQVHHRQPSDDSLRSLGSTASSSDPDTDSEADSLLTDRMTDRESMDEHTSHLATAFRNHLQGLHTILHQLSDSADYLSVRYQEEIDGCSF